MAEPAIRADAPTRCGFVALIGPPNSGKSTVTNVLVGAKVSIVTHKAQTTRGPVRGIFRRGASQIILVDTPGIFQPRRWLDRAMHTAAFERTAEADLVALVVDAEYGLDAYLEPVLLRLSEVRRPCIAVLNKIDKVEKPKLLKLAADLAARQTFDRIFMVSALHGEGVADIAAYLADTVPEGPWLFPPDQLTDASLRQTAAEITREKLYLRLHNELPYSSTVETTDWKELKDGGVRIEQTIYVERGSQRKIVLGAKGATIKEIGTAARKEIAAIVDAPVHLFLFVKVRERWATALGVLLGASAAMAANVTGSSPAAKAPGASGYAPDQQMQDQGALGASQYVFGRQVQKQPSASDTVPSQQMQDEGAVPGAPIHRATSSVDRATRMQPHRQ
jgi:GTP-binding protein Era